MVESKLTSSVTRFLVVFSSNLVPTLGINPESVVDVIILVPGVHPVSLNPPPSHVLTFSQSSFLNVPSSAKLPKTKYPIK